MLAEILQQQTTKVIENRENCVLHASDTDDPFCARQQYYRYKYKESKVQSSFLTFTFDIGFQVENLIRNVYLKDYMFGPWECGTTYNNEGGITKCSELSPYGKFPYWNCASCGCYNWKYKEISWVCDKLGISCSFDGFLEIDGQIYLLEIKTMKEDLFKKLTQPLPHQKKRTQIYMNCLQYFPEFQIAPIAYIVYCAKSSGVWNGSQVVPFQVYEIEYENLEQEILDKVSPYYKSLLTEIFPSRICKSQQDKFALQCQFFLRCMTNKSLIIKGE